MPLPPLPNGCVEFGGCKGGAAVRYCEVTGSHGSWPKVMDDPMFEFFAMHALP